MRYPNFSRNTYKPSEKYSFTELVKIKGFEVVVRTSNELFRVIVWQSKAHEYCEVRAVRAA